MKFTETNESMGPGPFDSFGALRPFPRTRARNRAKCTPGRAPQAAPERVSPGRGLRRRLRQPLGECTSAFFAHGCSELREVHWLRVHRTTRQFYALLPVKHVGGIESAYGLFEVIQAQPDDLSLFGIVFGRSVEFFFCYSENRGRFGFGIAFLEE